jgi:hypothetical protein
VVVSSIEGVSFVNNEIRFLNVSPLENQLEDPARVKNDCDFTVIVSLHPPGDIDCKGTCPSSGFGERATASPFPYASSQGED